MAAADFVDADRFERVSAGIRSAVLEDLDAVCVIEGASNPSPWTRAAFESEMNREVSTIDVMVENGVIVGFVVHWLVVGEGHLLNVAVSPDARRRGLGRALVEHVIEVARAAEGVYLMLEVRESNAAARTLYARFDFKLVARRERYYKDNQEAALVLGLVLA